MAGLAVPKGQFWFAGLEEYIMEKRSRGDHSCCINIHLYVWQSHKDQTFSQNNNPKKRIYATAQKKKAKN